MLGLDKNAGPKYVKRYANLNETITKAITKFKEEVLNGDYPDREHSYHG
jgi:3-methyl-2-oxobutanoate hydroxymethyltransferase